MKFADWKPFFEAWELYGNFPDILNDKIVGKAARDLWDDANKMIKMLIKEEITKPKCVFGFWPANSDGDDILLFDSERRDKVKTNYFFYDNKLVEKIQKELISV